MNNLTDEEIEYITALCLDENFSYNAIAGLLANLNSSDIDKLDKIISGEDYTPSKKFNLPWSEWKISQKQPGYLAAAYMINAVKPVKKGPFQQWEVGKLAEKMFLKITGINPEKWLPPEVVLILKKRRKAYELY